MPRAIRAQSYRARQSFSGPSLTEGPFYCGVCQKELSHLADYRRHAKSHDDAKKWKCSHPGCQFATREKSNFSTHQKIHTGVKDQQCTWPLPGDTIGTLCTFRCTDPSSLNRHIRGHVRNAWRRGAPVPNEFLHVLDRIQKAQEKKPVYGFGSADTQSPEYASQSSKTTFEAAGAPLPSLGPFGYSYILQYSPGGSESTSDSDISLVSGDFSGHPPQHNTELHGNGFPTSNSPNHTNDWNLSLDPQSEVSNSPGFQPCLDPLLLVPALMEGGKQIPHYRQQLPYPDTHTPPNGSFRALMGSFFQHD